ncbi:probable G-protein coupled receptor 82 [Salminus brasiliensis]|uniref:probable G-protein coupled receptor 82 n=1 Tax=Salminus brasiliensis TaxID=930266 RepID=UPI003B82CB0F
MSEQNGNVTNFTEISGATSNDSKRCFLESRDHHISVLPWFYLTLAILGFLANALAMLDLWRSEKTPTVIFTLNIVVSDLMVCCSFPFRMAYYITGPKWGPGSTVCLTTEFLMVSCFYINLYCNMCFLLWTSINRYATVVQPRWGLFQAFRQPKLCWVICIVTWILGIITISSSMGYKANLKSTGQELNTCFEKVMNKGMEQINVLHGIGVGMFFFILGLMLVSYGLLIFHLQKVRGGSMVGVGFGPGGGLKVRRKILASVILFVSCFLPYHVQRIRIMAASDSENCLQKNEDMKIKTLTILVAALSCCLHPALHLVLRLPCCRVKRNTRAPPKPEITRSQVTPNIHATELTQNFR